MKIRTGRAHTGLLEHITVDYYGSPTPISQVAQLGFGRCQNNYRSAVGKEKWLQWLKKLFVTPISA